MKKTLETICAKAVEKIIDLWRRRDVEALKEDSRKLGLGLAGGGLLGFILQTDTITTYEAIALIVVGILIWIIGIIETGGGE